MSDETSTLEELYATFYRATPDIERILERAGIDPSFVSLDGSTPATAWHTVLTKATQEGVMPELYAIIKREHPRNKALIAAWDAYTAQQGTHEPTPKQNQPKEYPPIMSENWRYDIRIDALQKEVADLRTLVAELRTNLAYLVSQSANLEQQNKNILAVLEQQNKATRERNHKEPLPYAYSWYAAFFLFLAVIIIVLIYNGGRI